MISSCEASFSKQSLRTSGRKSRPKEVAAIRKELNKAQEQPQHGSKEAKSPMPMGLRRPQPAAYGRTPAQLSMQTRGILCGAAVQEVSTSSRSPLVGLSEVKAKDGRQQGKPRLVLLCLPASSTKVDVSAVSKLRAHDFTLDEYLTALEKQQRHGLAADRAALKSQGFDPFFRKGALKCLQP